MKTRLLSLVAGTALIASVSFAQAAEPLDESQMDEITAGLTITVTSGTVTFALPTQTFTFNPGTGVVTKFEGA